MKKSKNEGSQRQSQRRQEHRLVKFTPMDHHLFDFINSRNEISTILIDQRPFQQFLVDTYCRIDKERLSYPHRNRNRFRSAHYKVSKQYLKDTRSAGKEREDGRSGTLCVLRTTFI